MKTIKFALLALIISSQVFYFKAIVMPDLKAATVKPGQVWVYKSTLQFHENDAPEIRTVIAVKNQRVQYTIPEPQLPGGVFQWDCSARIFVADSKLIK